LSVDHPVGDGLDSGSRASDHRMSVRRHLSEVQYGDIRSRDIDSELCGQHLLADSGRSLASCRIVAGKKRARDDVFGRLLGVVCAVFIIVVVMARR